MSKKKYLLVHKKIFNQTNDSFGNILDVAFDKDVIFYEYISPKKESKNCQINIHRKDEKYLFGKFGVIMHSLSENASAIVEGKEYDDVQLKYSVQFLIDIDSEKMIYINNKNVSIFEDCLSNFIDQKNNTINSFVIALEESDNLKEKLKNAKKITNIFVKQNDPNKMTYLFKEFENKIPISSVTFDYKIKDKELDKNQVIDLIEKKQDSNCQLKFIDEYDVERVTKFTEYMFNKSERIEIESEDLKNKEKIFMILKEHLMK